VPEQKKIIIIAGPNGAGKTTFAKAFLPNEANCPVFINADLIAAGIAPFAPESAAIAAGRIMLKMIDDAVMRSDSFAFETTLSGITYAQKIKLWRELGYHVKLAFIELRSSEAAMRRVALRVSQGGHNIPEATIVRRFKAGIENFETVYKPIVDSWLHFDGTPLDPLLIDWSER
jgi:predicted ABC-type ATPase